MFEQHTADTKKFKDDLLKEVIENEVKKPLQAEEILRMTSNSCDIKEIGLRCSGSTVITTMSRL